MNDQKFDTLKIRVVFYGVKLIGSQNHVMKNIIWKRPVVLATSLIFDTRYNFAPKCLSVQKKRKKNTTHLYFHTSSRFFTKKHVSDLSSDSVKNKQTNNLFTCSHSSRHKQRNQPFCFFGIYYFFNIFNFIRKNDE